MGGTTGITTTGNENVTLQTGDALSIDQAVNVGTGNVTLNVTNGATQAATGNITAGGLELLGNGTITLTSATNDVDTLAADVAGAISYQAAGALSVGTVGGTTGITTTGNENVTLQTGDALSIDQAVNVGTGNVTLNVTNGATQAATGNITAGGLELLGNGTITLTSATNDVDTLAADVAGAISYQAAGALSVGTVGGTTGITTTGNENVTLQTGDALSIDQAVNVGTGNVTLNVTNGATQAATGNITAGGLELLGNGTITLTSATNDVDTLAADVAGAISYQAAARLSVGTVGGTTGITTTGNENVTLQTGDALSIDQAVNVGTGNVTLNVTNGATQAATGNITAGGLELLGNGTITLTSATNDVDTLAADVAGAISYQAAGALSVGTVGGTTGITTTGNENVTLQTGDALSIDQAVNVGTGNVTLNVTNGATQAATGNITAGGLELLGNGTITLTSATNNVDTLAADVAGAISYQAAGALSVGTVGGTTGITTTGNENVTLQTGDALSIDQAVNVGTGNVTLNVTNGATQAATGNITAGGLELLGNGTITLTSATNNVDTLAADVAGAISYQAAGALSVGTVGGTTGITTTGNENVTLQTGDALSIDQAVNVGTGNVTLNVTNGATQAATGNITAGGLELLGNGTITLTSATNNVDTLAADVAGAISYQAAGSERGHGGRHDGDHDDGERERDVADGRRFEHRPGGQRGHGERDVERDERGDAGGDGQHHGGRVGTAGQRHDHADERDQQRGHAGGGRGRGHQLPGRGHLSVGTVGGTTGITTTGNENVTLQTGDALSIDQAVNVGTGNVTLNVTNGATQAATGNITAGGLELLGNGTITLTSATNNVDTLAADVAGAISYQAAGA